MTCAPINVLPLWLSSKESTCNAGDTGSIPGLERYPGEGKGNPPQYCYLGNPRNRGAWWATVCGFTKVGHNLVTEQKQCTVSVVSYFSSKICTHTDE